MIPDRHPTFAEAFRATIKTKSSWLVILFGVVMFGWTGWEIHGAMLVEKANGNPHAISDASLLFALGGMFVFMVFLMLYMGISERMGRETKSEIEERERALARKLLAKYPDLRDQHDAG